MELSNKGILLILAIAIPLFLAQGTWMFIDAKKRGERFYWLWGIFGLINTPGNLIIYLLITRVILKNPPKDE